jgi:dTDP-4-dehydrorhamnose 3,5-epimerase
MSQDLAVHETTIPGLYTINLVLHEDDRGWFKENYQQQKMESLGLPHFEPVQNNFSYNKSTGVTRGLHAEPWEKFISLANGTVFGVWVDLRSGEGFGKVFTMQLSPDKAIFVPRGVANGYQTLVDDVTYTYLVNDHWSAEAQYASVNLYDSGLGIQWPIERKLAIVSDKDLQAPYLKDVKPMDF